MKLPLVLVTVLFTAVTLRADMVIIQKVDGAGQAGEMTMKVSGDKVRVDVSPQVSTITNAATGDIITLMHPQKAYMLVSAAATKAMIEQVRKGLGQTDASASPAAIKATGRKDKVNGYDASEYTFSNGTMKATYWVSTEFPNGQKVMDAMAKFQKGSLAQMGRGLAPDTSTLPGVPIKTEVEVNGQKIVTELESAKEQAIDPSEFQAPADYKEMKMPTMPAQ